MSNPESASGRNKDMRVMSKSSIATRKQPNVDELRPLITPGEYLSEEFLQPLDLSEKALARDLKIPTNRILAILHGQRGITADTAMRLAQYFGTSPEFWMNLQQAYELDRARREKWGDIQAEVKRRPPRQQTIATSVRKRVRRQGVHC